MDLYLRFFVIYLLVINILSILITVYDKISAIHRHWRVKESTLLIFSALGGSVCMYLIMLMIRHKTRHIKFMIGIPIIFAFQCILIFIGWRILYG